MIVIALAAGLLGIVLSLALRRNTEKSRRWEETQGIIDDKFVYLSIPGVSLLLCGFGILGLTQPLIGGAGFATVLGIIGSSVAALIIIFGIYLSVLGLFASKTPVWAIPKWKRQK